MTVARVLTLLLVLLATLGVSCRSEQLPPSSRDAERPRSAELDVAALQRRAHFAFRPSGDLLTAGHATFGASVRPDGSLRFVPRWRGEGGRPSFGEPSVAFATRSIARGAELGDAPRVRLEDDGSVTVARGAVLERLRASPRGLEQSWEFAAEPAGSGDLVVRVGVDTRASIRETRAGARFASGGRAVTYTHARWVDREGKATELGLRVEGADVVVVVPARVVASSSYPAVLDPTISPELAPSDAAAVATSFDWRHARVTAGKGGAFLLTWADDRVTSIDSGSIRGYFQAFAARVAADGTLLDPTGIVVGPPRDFDVEKVRAAFDGQTWLVAWQEDEINGPCSRVQAARVAETGAVLDLAGITVSCADNPNLEVGYDGDSFVIAWPSESLTTTGNAQLAKRVTSAGAVKSLLPFTIAEGIAANPTEGTQAFACDGAAHCLYVHQAGAGLRGVRLAKGGGAVGGEIVITAAPTDSKPRVVFDGTSFVVGWVDGASATSAVRVTPATGALVDAAPIAIAPAAFESLAAAGGQTLFAWGDGATKQVRGIRLSSGGVVLDASPLSLTAAANVIEDAQRRVTVGASGAQYLVAWPDPRGMVVGNGLHFARVDASGASLDGDGKIARYAAAGQIAPTVAGDASGYLVVWESLGKGDYTSRIEGMRLSGAGAKVDAAPFVIATNGTTPRVAKGSNGYLVVWAKSSVSALPYGDVMAATVSTSGVVSAPVTVATSAYPAEHHQGTPYFDGANYHVVWGSYLNDYVRVRRIDPSGAIVDASPVTLGGDMIGYMGRVDITSDGTNMFAVWTALDSAANWKVVGRRFTKDLQVLDAAPITIVSLPYAHVFMSSVAWDGRQYLAAWQDYRYSDYANPDVYFSRITSGGVVLDPNGKLLATGLAHQAWPAIIGMRDGFTALVAWSEPRRSDRFQDFGIYGAFIRTSDGAILDPGGVALADLDGDELLASLSPAAAGSALLVYHRDDFSAGVGAQRARARFVSSGVAVGAACTTDAECVSRACADGVCCDTPCKDACRSCAKTPGTCAMVTSAEDLDSCAGDRACDAAGACMVKAGKSCARDDECTTGICSAGLCCDRRCDAPCETCAAPAGTCTLRPARSSGAPTCAPFACDGASATCPSRCESSAACPTGARCNAATGTCVDGGYCVDEVTLGGAGPEPVSCAPYRCASGACRTACRDVNDCVYPAVCDERGACALAPTPAAVGSGCSAAATVGDRGSAALGVFVAFVVASVALRRRLGGASEVSAPRGRRRRRTPSTRRLQAPTRGRGRRPRAAARRRRG